MAITSQPSSAAVVADAPKSAEPGTSEAQAPAAPKARKKLVVVEYPGLTKTNEDGSVERVKLTKIPADYKTTLHKPLKKADFVDEETFLIARAERFEEMAKNLRKQAEAITSLGNTAQRTAAKKLLKMQESMAALMATLKAQGVDTDALLKSSNVDSDDSAAE